jgi:hypothetical protein
MTYYEFSISPVSYQIALTIADGIEIAQRQEEAYDVKLYYLPDNFFVELYHTRYTNVTTKMRSFKEPVWLEQYASNVQLPY